MQLAGKVAVVTGGASGLGEATVRAYVEHGVRVAIFDRDRERGEAINGELKGAAAFHCLDVASEADVASAMDALTVQFGALHICNNFAGVAAGVRTLRKDGPHPLEAFRRVIEVNLVGTFNVCRLAATAMAANTPYDEAGGRGVIINTASVAAYEGQVGQAAYSASKGGVAAMTLPMARDLAPHGIRVNAIAPGLIHTPLCDGMADALYRSLISSVVHPKRMGLPSEVAHLCVAIAENEYINGECIRIDGALRLQPH